ncbi:MAG: ATP-binding cassette domain-containing protein [Saprospiraceae bacterium]|nr:ATP-binding cassette domain-containing protein [Saprospiraceae bacterium]
MKPPRKTLLIELGNVTAGQGNVKVLTDLSWCLTKGEHWLIKGQVGSGKTTLGKLLCGKARIFNGSMYIASALQRESGLERRSSVRMVSFTDETRLFHGVNAMHYYQQRYNAFDADGHLTGAEYLEEGGTPIAEATELLETLDLTDLVQLERIKLSSGQTRRLLLAKAIITRPRVLILDNAYVGLDTKSRATFNSLIDRLSRETDSTFIIIGDQQEAPSCITDTLLLANGRICKTVGGFREMTKRTLQPLTKYFRSIQPTATDSPVIELKNLSVRYPDTKVLHDINWQVQPGEKWGLLGPNGSGKSTLLALIYADHPQAYSNHVTLFGNRRGRGESIWDVKKRIGFTSAEIHAYFHHALTGLQIVLTGLSDSFVVPTRPDPIQLAAAHLFFEIFESRHLENRFFHQMSSGEQRLVFFFRALIKAPELLLLDEPFQAMDHTLMGQCRDMLTTLLGDQHTLVFITHYAEEIPSSVEHIFELEQH